MFKVSDPIVILNLNIYTGCPQIGTAENATQKLKHHTKDVLK